MDFIRLLDTYEMNAHTKINFIKIYIIYVIWLTFVILKVIILIYYIAGKIQNFTTWQHIIYLKNNTQIYHHNTSNIKSWLDIMLIMKYIIGN